MKRILVVGILVSLTAWANDETMLAEGQISDVNVANILQTNDSGPPLVSSESLDSIFSDISYIEAPPPTTIASISAREFTELAISTACSYASPEVEASSLPVNV